MTPISGRGICKGVKGQGRRGFTLIEVLAVLLILGLFAGLVSAVTQPDERDLLEGEAERLARLLDLAAAESRLTGKSIAWASDGAGYRFWRLHEDGGWSEVQDNDLLRARSLPRGMAIGDLRVETTRTQEAMRLEFAPYGPAPVFTVRLSLGAEAYTVAASPFGEVRAAPPGAEDTDDGVAPR